MLRLMKRSRWWKSDIHLLSEDIGGAEEGQLVGEKKLQHLE